MTTSFNLLKTAEAVVNETEKANTIIRESFAAIAVEQGTDTKHLAESVTHVLANLANAVSQGEPLQLMHTNSVAAFFAGVERMVTALPKLDPVKQEKAIRVLSAAAVGSDGHVTHEVAKVAELGAKHPDLYQKYLQLVSNYVASVDKGQPAGQQLAQVAKKLQFEIDRAMRASTPSQIKPAQMRPAVA